VPRHFLQVAESASFLPRWITEMIPEWMNRYVVYGGVFAIGAALILQRSRQWEVAGERLVAWLLVLSPFVHAWYFTWLIPFAVGTGNRGTLAVSLSGFIYFRLQAHLGSGQEWRLTPLEWALLWAPFILGWCWTEWQRANRKDSLATK
jgi:alpha-1,6-mannosyltransferase